MATTPVLSKGRGTEAPMGLTHGGDDCRQGGAQIDLQGGAGFGEGESSRGRRRGILTLRRRRMATTVAERRHWLLASARLPEAAALGRGEEWRRTGASMLQRPGDSRGDGGDRRLTG
ncbi:hypothetical protein E2562_011405, partial [Oryza meyeriana var. granulata]